MAEQLPDGLSILMPVYNEIERIERALDATLAVNLPCPFELVLVDDGSTDGTVDYLRNRSFPDNVRVHFHERNQGKGAAVRTALTDARLRFSAFFDAALEYARDDLAALVTPLRDDDAVHVVYGVRTFDGYTSHSFLYVMGNKGVTLAANVLFNVYLRDLMTCHKAIRTDVFRGLPLSARGFDIEPEIAARLIQCGERIYEVPVSYKARATDEGKKLTAADGLRVLKMLLRCRLSPPRAN